MLAKLLASLVPKNSGPGAASRKAIDAYIASHSVRKLHLGAGSRSAPGWLATDLSPHSEAVVYLDAARPFPIADGTFDYVFSEHMIEHMPWQAGSRMLEECFRVTKPGGTIRIATPDCAVLLGLYSEPRDDTSERYIRWITDKALPGVDVYSPVFVINNAFRNWGHQFLYDEPLLTLALTRAGFANVRRCRYGESTDPNLSNIESHGRNVGNEAMAAFETMVFEADRPA